MRNGVPRGLATLPTAGARRAAAPVQSAGSSPSARCAGLVLCRRPRLLPRRDSRQYQHRQQRAARQHGAGVRACCSPGPASASARRSACSSRLVLADGRLGHHRARQRQRSHRHATACSATCSPPARRGLLRRLYDRGARHAPAAAGTAAGMTRDRGLGGGMVALISDRGRRGVLPCLRGRRRRADRPAEPSPASSPWPGSASSPMPSARACHLRARPAAPPAPSPIVLLLQIVIGISMAALMFGESALAHRAVRRRPRRRRRAGGAPALDTLLAVAPARVYLRGQQGEHGRWNRTRLAA